MVKTPGAEILRAPKIVDGVVAATRTLAQPLRRGPIAAHD